MKRLVPVLSLAVLLLSSCAAMTGGMVQADPARERVVLLHGFGRSTLAMGTLASKLEDAGYAVETIGYSSLTQDIEGIKSEVFAKIEACCAGAARVHFVGHSLGGLLVRAYLGEHAFAALGNVVTLGSPSSGTEVVDHYKDKWYFPLAGPAAISLSTHGSEFLASLRPPTYNLGVIAGDAGDDGNEHIMPGKDDGLVRVESTKVPGMKDFIVLATTHWGMRRDDEVARQVVSFLRTGRFDRAK